MFRCFATVFVPVSMPEAPSKTAVTRCNKWITAVFLIDRSTMQHSDIQVKLVIYFIAVRMYVTD